MALFEKMVKHSNVKRNKLTFEEKSDICEQSLKPDFDREKVMEKYGIKRSCLYNILAKKSEFLK